MFHTTILTQRNKETGIIVKNQIAKHRNQLYTLIPEVIKYCYYLDKRFAIHTIYNTAQFKLDRTRVQHGLNMTRFSFHTCASLHVHARLMMSNLPCIALVYALDVRTIHACMSGMHTAKFGLHVYANCKPRTAEETL